MDKHHSKPKNCKPADGRAKSMNTSGSTRRPATNPVFLGTLMPLNRNLLAIGKFQGEDTKDKSAKDEEAKIGDRTEVTKDDVRDKDWDFVLYPEAKAGTATMQTRASGHGDKNGEEDWELL